MNPNSQNLEIERKFLLKEGRRFFDIRTETLFNNLQIEVLINETVLYGRSLIQYYFPNEIGQELVSLIFPKNPELHTKNFSTYRLSLYKEKSETQNLYFTAKTNGTLSREEYEKHNLEIEKFSKYFDLPETKVVRKYRLIKEYKINDRLYNLEFDFYPDRIEPLFIVEVEFDSLESAVEFPMIALEITEESSYKNINMAV